MCRPSVVLGLTAVVLGPALGCVTSRALEPLPNGSLQVRGGGVEARVKRVHLKWGSYKGQGPDQVVIEVANHTPRKLRLIPTKIQVVALKETLPPQMGRPLPVPAYHAVEEAPCFSVRSSRSRLCSHSLRAHRVHPLP